MKPRRMPHLSEGAVNVTPLIDVVLCLVIFFMIAAKIGVAGGVDESIRLPVTELGHELATHSNVLILNVAAGPKVTALVDRSQRTPRTIALVDPKTKAHPLEEILKRLHAKNPAMQIIIRGDARMMYADFRPVLEACADAGISSVDFGTKESSTGWKPVPQ
jgi:biopolymer transport protein ExbD